MQNEVGRRQQLNTRAVDARDGGMIAMAHIEGAEALAVALGAGDHHAARDEVIGLATIEAIVRDLAQGLQVLLVAFVADNTHHIARIKDRVRRHQLVGTAGADDTRDEGILNRTTRLQVPERDAIINRQADIQADWIVVGAMLAAQTVFLLLQVDATAQTDELEGEDQTHDAERVSQGITHGNIGRHGTEEVSRRLLHRTQGRGVHHRTRHDTRHGAHVDARQVVQTNGDGTT